MTEDVPFYVDLACETEGPLVELAIGNGRVAIPVARATGKTVIGIDSSPSMLALEWPRQMQASSLTYAKATCAISKSTSPRD